MKEGLVKRAFLATIIAAAGTLLSLSCGRYESCDPGQVMQFNVCFPGLVDGGLPDVGGAAPATCRPPVIPDGGDDMCTDKTSGFGEPCSADSQCRCGKDLCAIIPGETCGFCTRSGCLADPSICPGGWMCYDASAFQPGYSLCVKM
jgi:hypothetical protein